MNHLAPLLLAHLLLPLLRSGAPARIVNVASVGQAPLDFANLMLERGYDGFRAYCRSKLAMGMATIELADRLDPSEVTVNALHPGSLLDTKMVREGFGAPQGAVDIGIAAELYLATSADVEGVSANTSTAPVRHGRMRRPMSRGASAALAGKPEARGHRGLRLSQASEVRGRGPPQPLAPC